MNALTGRTQRDAADQLPVSRAGWSRSLRLTAALVVAGSACGPLVQSAAASSSHRDASRSVHVRHHDARRSVHVRHHLAIVATRRTKKLTVKDRRPRLIDAPALTLSGDTVSWGASYPASELRGAISTAPRGAAGRQTRYVSLAAGHSWTLVAQPGETLFYGVEIDGKWDSKEIKKSWPAASALTPTPTPTPTPAPAPAPTPAPAPAPSGGSSAPMQVGLNESGYGANGASDVASSFKLDRMDMSSTENASDFWTRGVAVDMDFSGPYNTGGVSAINATSWVQNAVNTFQSECDGSVTNCPSLEVLNEPYGSWFWGPNAEDAANEAAYAHLVADTYTAFHNQYGSASPKILAAFDDNSWWHGMQAAVPNIDSYVDGVTVHPYGGTSSVTSSALGDQALVIAAHQTTGLPIWVTEFGWPTTGDSMQWNFSQQATNTYNFVTWLRSLGYVSAAIDFNYQDYGTNDFYGVETSSGVKKPAWTALSEAAGQQPCTVCNA
jgi:hypothetical protein